MDAIDALLTRRSTKADQQVPPGPGEKDLKTLLTIGLRVPDHGRLMPWRVQILRKPGQQALGQFLADLYARDHPGTTAEALAIEAAKPCRSPLLLVVTSRIKPSRKVPEIEQILSGGAVCQSLLLGAHALGYTGIWLTGWAAGHREVIAHLGHDPDHDQILGFIHLGSCRQPAIDRPRPDLAEIVSEWEGPAAAD